MKKILLVLNSFAITFLSCTSNYQTANTLLNNILQGKKSFDSLATIQDYQVAVQEALVDQASGMSIKQGTEPDYIISPQYIESLKAKGEAKRATALEELNRPLMLIMASKTRFKEVVSDVSDEAKKAELLKKYKEVYGADY